MYKNKSVYNRSNNKSFSDKILLNHILPKKYQIQLSIICSKNSETSNYIVEINLCSLFTKLEIINEFTIISKLPNH